MMVKSVHVYYFNIVLFNYVLNLITDYSITKITAK